MLADLTTDDAYTVRGLVKLRRARPGLALLIRTDAVLSRETAMTRLLESPKVDFIRSFADADELEQRLRRLMNHQPEKPSPKRFVGAAGRHLLPELHDPKSGRLNARSIAMFFGVPLADIARAVGKSLSAIHKTPDAVSLQDGLFPFERIATALLTLAGSAENARVYLNLPEAQLGNKTPLSLLRDGRGVIVAQMLDDMLTGQPS